MSNSIIKHMLSTINETIVLVCLNHSERKRVRDQIWSFAKENLPSLVKVWLPTAYTLRCVSESIIILVTVDTAERALRGRSIDVLLLTNTIENSSAVLWNLNQQLRIKSIQGTFYESMEEI